MKRWTGDQENVILVLDFVMVNGINYPNNDIQTFSAANQNVCADQCQKTVACKLFAYSRRQKRCWLKNIQGQLTIDGEYLTGVKNPQGDWHFLLANLMSSLKRSYWEPWLKNASYKIIGDFPISIFYSIVILQIACWAVLMLQTTTLLKFKLGMLLGVVSLVKKFQAAWLLFIGHRRTTVGLSTISMKKY